MTFTNKRSSVNQPPAMRSVRNDFPFFDARGNGIVPIYLDNAATTQKPWPVIRSMVEYYCRDNSNIGRGYYTLSRRATDRYEAARETVARWLNARHCEEIVFTRGATDALNLLADTFGRRRVRSGDQVVVTGLEHNSNLLPWRRLCEQVGAELITVPVVSGRVEHADFLAALGPHVRLVAASHVSNVLGTVNPLAKMIEEAHRWNIPVVVDGAQMVAHRPVDVQALDADFYCFSGHKVYGPMGSGVLYGRRELLRELPPYQVGGGTVKCVSPDRPVCYVPIPSRMEAGTPDVAAAIGLGAALDYLGGLGWDLVRQHDDTLVRTAVEVLCTIDRVRVIGDPAADPHGIVSFVMDGLHPYDVGTHLDRHGIAVRSGVHCASTFLDSLGLVGTVRMSFAVYNTETEMEAVARALRTVQPGEWTTRRPKVRFLEVGETGEAQCVIPW
jgi:cysteine desulfurase/selenocysteine lyase